MRGAAVVVALLAAVGAAALLGTGGPTVPVEPQATGRPGPSPTVSLPPPPEEPYSPPVAVGAALDGCEMQGSLYAVRWHVDLSGGTSWTSGGPGEHSRTGDRIDYADLFDARFFTISAAVVTSLVDGRRETVPLPEDARPSYQLSEVCT